jgi:hypothetical protein
MYAYDAYIIGCAMNPRAPILSLESVLRERARSLNIEVTEINTERTEFAAKHAFPPTGLFHVPTVHSTAASCRLK